MDLTRQFDCNKCSHCNVIIECAQDLGGHPQLLADVYLSHENLRNAGNPTRPHGFLACPKIIGERGNIGSAGSRRIYSISALALLRFALAGGFV